MTSSLNTIVPKISEIFLSIGFLRSFPDTSVSIKLLNHFILYNKRALLVNGMTVFCFFFFYFLLSKQKNTNKKPNKKD